MRFIDFVQCIAVDLRDSAGLDLHAGDSEHDDAIERSGVARLRSISGHQIEVSKFGPPPLNSARIKVDLSRLPLSVLSRAEKTSTLQSLIALNEREFPARVSYDLKNGTVSLSQSVHIESLSPPLIKRDVALFFEAMAATRLHLTAMQVISASRNIPIRFLPPANFSLADLQQYDAQRARDAIRKPNDTDRASPLAPDVTGHFKPLMASLEHAAARVSSEKRESIIVPRRPGRPQAVAPITGTRSKLPEAIDRGKDAVCTSALTNASPLGMTFSDFLQRLPAMWYKRPLIGVYDPGTAVPLGEGRGSFWTRNDSFAYCNGKDTLPTKVQRALYIESIALPCNAGAVALSARVVRFTTPANCPGPVASVIDMLNRSSPSITFLLTETPDDNGWQTTDVTIRQVMMISPVSQREIKERLRTLATIIAQTETFLVSLSRADLGVPRPSESDAQDGDNAKSMPTTPTVFSTTLIIATDALIYTGEYAFSALVQAIAIQNKPQNDNAFIAFATSLSQVIHQQRTGMWSYFGATPTLDLSRMHADNKISFWTSDQTEVCAIRMHDKKESFAFSACAYTVSIAGIGPADEPAFWTEIARIAAPFECLEDEFGNVALLHRICIADVSAKSLARQAADFWQRLLKVRDAFLKFETGSRTSGIVTHPLYDTDYVKRPIPPNLIAWIATDNASRLAAEAQAFLVGTAPPAYQPMTPETAYAIG